MRQKSRKITLEQCYKVLGINHDASLEDLKSAYRKRAFELHPDLHPDKPDANKLFQEVNEAYVMLSAVLKSKSGTSSSTRQEEHKEQSEASYSSRDQAKASASYKKAAEEHFEQAKTNQSSESTTSSSHTSHSATKASGDSYQSGPSEEEVLHDLLNDPFARRVFEDIYSEIDRKQANSTKQETKKQEQTKDKWEKLEEQQVEYSLVHRANPQNNLKALFKDGVGSWLRGQIDDEQSYQLPGHQLIPGAKLRLKIRRGLGQGEMVTVDIRLPYNFIPGKPVRLRGMGKKIGPWKGDLYLTLTPA